MALGKDMKYEDIKSALKRLFNKSSSTKTAQSAIIKQDEAFYSKSKYKSPNYPLLNNKKKIIKHNTLNEYGQISRCVVCDSKMHWADTCPHKNEKGSAYLVESNSSDVDDDDDNSEEINIVLITEEDDKSEIFVAEASTSAVIDKACTKKVAGEKWYKNHTSNLTEKARKEIITYPSNTSFKFGDGQKVQAVKRVVFLVLIAGKHCKISAEIVVDNSFKQKLIKKVQNSTQYEW